MTLITKQFRISDTHAQDIITAYVDFPRLPLREIITVDEVHLNISDSEKCVFVIMISSQEKSLISFATSENRS